MQTQRQLLHLSAASFLSPSLPPPPFSRNLYISGRPTNRCSLCSAHGAWLAQLSEELTTAVPPSEGPIDVRSFISNLISASDDVSSLQTAASFLITGAFSLYLLRTIRRGARRARERKLRSSALESVRNVELKLKGKKKKRSPPSPYETLFGALIGAAFGLLLYNFTISVEHTLNSQPLSPNYSVRQITITIRTIINGLCYLATFVFGFNSLGLFLYTGQLAMNSYVDVDVRASEDKAQSKIEDSSESEDQNSDSNVQK